MVGVAAAGAGADPLQQRGILAIAGGEAFVVFQPPLRPCPELLADCSGYSVGREQDDGELALAPRPSLAHLDVLTELVREAGLPAQVHVQGEAKPLPPGVDLSAYRIVREELTECAAAHRATPSIDVCSSPTGRCHTLLLGTPFPAPGC